MLRKLLCSEINHRLAAGLLAAVTVLSAGEGHATETGMLRLVCVNPAGGASWPVVVDLDRRLVDSQAATINDKWISWHPTGGGVYELERATGKLEFRAASSTGGFFLHYTCRTE